MLTVDAKGVFPIAPTPFLADGAIDMSSVDRMIDHYVAAGADGCTILGIMGEAPKLDQDEAIGFVARCVARAPKLPFIVGVSAPGFAAMRALSHAAMARGAAGVMIAPPPSTQAETAPGTVAESQPVAGIDRILAKRASVQPAGERPEALSPTSAPPKATMAKASLPMPFVTGSTTVSATAVATQLAARIGWRIEG